MGHIGSRVDGAHVTAYDQDFQPQTDNGVGKRHGSNHASRRRAGDGPDYTCRWPSLLALVELLTATRVAHAMVDFDALKECFPRPP